MDQKSYSRVSIIAGQLKALQQAMELSIDARTQEFARYESYKTFAIQFNALAKQAIPFLQPGIVVNGFDISKMGSPGNPCVAGPQAVF
jgi:hypothetical protein